MVAVVDVVISAMLAATVHCVIMIRALHHAIILFVMRIVVGNDEKRRWGFDSNCGLICGQLWIHMKGMITRLPPMLFALDIGFTPPVAPIKREEEGCISMFREEAACIALMRSGLNGPGMANCSMRYNSSGFRLGLLL